MDSQARQAIREAAGPENFSQSASDRLLYSGDATNRSRPPAAVVRAVDTWQVSRVLAACSAHGVPLTPRGAGSGLTGGAVPSIGGVLLDLSGLDRIVRIDPADQVAVVEPGVVTAELAAAAARRGMFYPPDPASVNFCTVGGNVANNAGGLKAVKYGVTRDYVLGLTAVLASGQVFRTGRGTIKTVVGYDLTRLLVGSEGTLAVLTELTLRLLPLPEAKATVSALFSDLDHAARAVQDILASGVRPTALEFMDAASLAAVEAYAGLGVGGAAAMVLTEVDGPPEVVDRQGGLLAGILERAGAYRVDRAADAAQSEQLWRARRAMGPAILKVARGKLNEDIVVPLGSLAEMVARIGGVSRERGVQIPSFGHAGDGNLHVNVMFDPDDPTAEAAAHQAVSDVFAHCLALGGSLSGEHGVGLTKLGYVGAELDPAALRLMHGIKRLFDPAGILNPGKTLPALEDPA